MGLSSVIYGLLYRPLTTAAMENEKRVAKTDEEMPLKPPVVIRKDVDVAEELKKDGSASERIRLQRSSRQRNAVSECETRRENEDDSSLQIPLSPITENSPSSYDSQREQGIGASSSTRARKNTNTRYGIFWLC
ncbi:unnamed protein product [Gongylonema pulchrum]|uniref:Uncharacterized protein n=1 Tax=Gongylonema pulchrum TaxID=637853 RepID=A0A3P6S0K1_9BILA|nr:unnamed protein product [Gongylonema pulchrum]